MRSKKSHPACVPEPAPKLVPGLPCRRPHSLRTSRLAADCTSPYHHPRSGFCARARLHLKSFLPEETISFHALCCIVGSHTLRGKFPASAFWTAALSFSDPVVPPLRLARSALRRFLAAREQWSRAAGFPAAIVEGVLRGQFPHIPRPRPVHQCIHGFRGDGFDLLLHTASEVLYEMRPRFLSSRCFRFAHNPRDGVNQSYRIVVESVRLFHASRGTLIQYFFLGWF